jgi:hypothetical protein
LIATGESYGGGSHLLSRKPKLAPEKRPQLTRLCFPKLKSLALLSGHLSVRRPVGINLDYLAAGFEAIDRVSADNLRRLHTQCLTVRVLDSDYESHGLAP